MIQQINRILAHPLINKTAAALSLYPHLKNTSAWGKLAQKLDAENPYEMTDTEKGEIIAKLHGLADFINSTLPRDGEAANQNGLGRRALDGLKNVNPALARLLDM